MLGDRPAETLSDGVAHRQVAIFRQYIDYKPPVDLTKTVRLLLHYLPDGYLASLNSIVLTNSTSSRQLRRGKTWSRGRKVAMADCAGFYCGDHIELLVDNLLSSAPGWCARLPLTRHMMVAYVLYHEI